MISICNILPNNCINENMPRQDYELYLTHKILEDPKKFEFLSQDKQKDIKSYKILDNSACELGEGMNFDKVLEAASIIGADEVVLPDIRQGSCSLSKTLETLVGIDANSLPYRLAAVVQGTTVEEVLQCATQILTLANVRTIMLPKWYATLNSTNGLGRINLTYAICDKMRELGVYKAIHWLGLGTGIRELISPASDLVRSVDTGYFAALSTPQWNHLNVASERPKELKIDLEYMDVDMTRFKQLIVQQQKLLGEMV